MIDVFICEDQKEQREKIARYVSNYIMIENLDMQLVLTTADPEEILAYIKESNRPGLYFLDIDLNHEMNGITLGAEIRKIDPIGDIVFITTHSELTYLNFIYKVAAMDFIIKDDVDSVQSKIVSCLKVTNERKQVMNKTSNKKFVQRVADKIISVNYDDIMFFESSPLHKVVLHLDNRQVEFYGKLKDIEKEYEGFIRCHNSYVVNIDNIQELDLKKKEILMENGETCYGSARMIKAVQKKLEMNVIE
ncbi:LytTR family DNA-binding domain-containing protein [Lysinibacillus sp. M3]|uniref:LytTR family DNA-binding domain-containing protein n=1 Tax=Lysinibacillus zambalensis TaxID=3160866 RepID=A0ABV1MZ41_9BACI